MNKVMQMRNLILLLIGLLVLGTAKAQNPLLSFVIDSQTYLETSGTVLVNVMITNPNANPTSVTISAVGGNAVNGVNYIFSPVTVTFPASSQTNQAFTVNILDDSIPDGDKFVIFGFDTLSATNGATIDSPATFKLVMQDADTPKVSFTLASATVSENTAPVAVGVSLSRGVLDTTKVRVKLFPTGTTAVKGVDFTYTDTTLVWPPVTAGTHDVVIPVINNPFYEHQRTVELSLDSATNASVMADSGTFTLTIRATSGDTVPGCSDLFFGQYVEGFNQDRAVQIYNPTAVPIDLSVYSVLISHFAGTVMTQYNLSGTIAPKGVYTLCNDYARAGIQAYANVSTSFIDFDGTDAVALLHNTDTIDIIGQFYVNPGPAGFTVGTGSTHQHTLIRNYYVYSGDTSWARAVSSWDVYRAELIDSLGFHNADTCGGLKPIATVQFITHSDTMLQVPSYDYIVIEVNNPTVDTVTFSVAMDPNRTTAVEGVGHDILYSNNDFVIPPGHYFDTFWIEIFQRPEITPIKTVTLIFINVPDNVVVLADSIYTLYLYNNNKFIVSFLGAGYTYPKGAGRVEIPVVATTYSSQPTTVDVSLSLGSAVLGQDFLFNDTTITFPAFSIDTQGVWVTINNNNLYEANKQANFDLSNPSNGAVLGISGFTLTIVNNDSLAGGISSTDFGETLKIFPNPVYTNLMLRTTRQLTGLVVVDVLGNVIINLGSLPVGSSSLDLSVLPSGVYFLKTKECATCNLKFVKID